ncbi:hypothetical protein BD413DRAFT_250758 [Trametes elegans]|nr:hypothetical protein BD413DRAFT_250758 [Trametes elegans]
MLRKVASPLSLSLSLSLAPHDFFSTQTIRISLWLAGNNSCDSRSSRREWLCLSRPETASDWSYWQPFLMALMLTLQRWTCICFLALDRNTCHPDTLYLDDAPR